MQGGAHVEGNADAMVMDEREELDASAKENRKRQARKRIRRRNTPLK